MRMLKITWITVGDTPKGAFAELKNHYTKQLRPFVDLDHKVIEDAERAVEKIPSDQFFIVLDATGDKPSTEEFALQIRQLEDQGRHITILLGGAKGLSADIKTRADLLLSLSPMTTTHDIAHIFFLEQLYRACTINRGKTYHY